MDPIDYFLYEEFLEPGMIYECRNCGTRFGSECVIWNEEAQWHMAVCPSCCSQSLLSDDVDEEDA